MTYDIDYTVEAMNDMFRLAKSEPKAYNKLKKLIEELREHPESGTGHPHRLRGDRVGQWSRSITSKHRLVYTINNNEVVILILAAYGHYDDK